MKSGIYFDLSNDDYHSGDGINKGLLDVVARSPMHARAILDRANDNDREPTPQQALGSALHALVLEPETFADQYVCELTQADAPDAIADRDVLVSMVQELNAGRLAKLPTGGSKGDLIARILAAYDEQGWTVRCALDELEEYSAAQLKATVELLNAERAGLLSTSGNMHELAAILAANGRPVTLWQDVRARWNAENEGHTVLAAETFNQLLAMRDAIRAHPAASALLTGEGMAEASVYWTDPETSELCRCRPDWWRPDGIVVDLKTTRDASPEGFAKSVAEYRYHVQAPWYLTGTRAAFEMGALPDGWTLPETFAFIAVESAAPHAVGVYILDLAAEMEGTTAMRENLATLAECKRTGIWPGYGDKIAALSLPPWYLARMADRRGE